MITQGDKGTYLKLFIKENYIPVDLSNATIKLKIKQSSRLIEKTALITGLGECEAILTPEDISVSGDYLCQATITFDEDHSFGSDIQTFKVGEIL